MDDARRRIGGLRGSRRLDAWCLLCTLHTLCVLGVLSLSGCKSQPAKPQPAVDAGVGDVAHQAAADDDVTPAPDSVPAPPPPAARPSPGTMGGISVLDLVALLKARKELRDLTPETALLRFARLVPAFEETRRDDERWVFEGSNDSGFVSVVTLTFLPTATDNWVFGAVAVRLHTDDPRRTFDEIRRAANATLKKPKWMDLNTGNRTAWNLGENWELVVAVLEDGDVQVRSGRPPRP